MAILPDSLTSMYRRGATNQIPTSAATDHVCHKVMMNLHAFFPHSVRFLQCTVRGYFLSLTLVIVSTFPPGTHADSPSRPVESYSGSPALPGSGLYSPRTVISTSFGTSYQVNVNGSGQNIA